MSWTAKKSNETVLLEAVTRSFINRIHKRHVTFFGPVMRREKKSNGNDQRKTG